MNGITPLGIVAMLLIHCSIALLLFKRAAARSRAHFGMIFLPEIHTINMLNDMIKSGSVIAVWKRVLTACTLKDKDMLKTDQSGIFAVVLQAGRAGDPVTGRPVVDNGDPLNTPSPARGFACK